MTLAEFYARFPEFAGGVVTDALVQAKLDSAAATTSALPSAIRDLAQGLRAAHLLSLSPFGQQARLVADLRETTYEVEYQSILRAHVGGPIASSTPSG